MQGTLSGPIKTRFVFKKKENPDMAYNPPAIEYSYYQICSYYLGVNMGNFGARALFQSISALSSLKVLCLYGKIIKLSTLFDIIDFMIAIIGE